MNPTLAEVVRKLRWSVNSGEWSTTLKPHECEVLLDALGDRPAAPVSQFPRPQMAEIGKSEEGPVEAA